MIEITATGDTTLRTAGKYCPEDILVKVPKGVQLPELSIPGTASDLVQGKELINENGEKVTGTMADNGTVTKVLDANTTSYAIASGKHSGSGKVSISTETKSVTPKKTSQTVTSSSGKVISSFTVEAIPSNYIEPSGTLNVSSNGTHSVTQYASVNVEVPDSGTKLPTLENPGSASDLALGKQLIDQEGNIVEGTALIPGGGFIYPDGAFMPVSNFTAGKQYALVAVIDGVRRYINTTTYNDYTMNATQITIGEDAGDYVIFSNTPVLFTAVASGDGFLLQNGSNYLHGTSSGGTSLRVGTTQMVWTVDTSATAGFSDGKYYAKEDSNAVWLMNNSSGYNWSIKYETAGSFGYDREGRDNTYSTGFVSFVLYEYVAGEGELNPVVDSSDASVTADQMLAGASGYAKGKLVEGNIQSKGAATITPSTTAQYIEPGVYLAGRQTIAAIQTENKTVTANGTYNPSSGKYFSSFTVNVPTGNSDATEVSGTYSDVYTAQSFEYDEATSQVYWVPSFTTKEDMLVKAGTKIGIKVKDSDFGDATADDVRSGKTFTSSNGFQSKGTATIGGGSVVKTGTTTSATIATGLSSIEEFFIYKESITATGLIHLHYSKTGGTSYLHASAWSTNNYGTKTITNGTTAATVNGGSITIPGTSATTGGLSSSVTYKWTAIGKE